MTRKMHEWISYNLRWRWWRWWMKRKTPRRLTTGESRTISRLYRQHHIFENDFDITSRRLVHSKNKNGSITCRPPYNSDYAKRIVFLNMSLYSVRVTTPIARKQRTAHLITKIYTLSTKRKKTIYN